jgi:hypothetical protein
MQQAQLFTSLATSRINELNGELEPVKEARHAAENQLAEVIMPACVCMTCGPCVSGAWACGCTRTCIKLVLYGLHAG